MKTEDEFPLNAGKRLIKLAFYKMPFGKYQGRYLSDLPETYIIWFRNQGFPKGELGEFLTEMIDIKANGLEYLLKEIRTRRQLTL